MNAAGQIIVPVTCSAAAYSANDCIGGLLAVKLPEYGVIEAITLSDAGQQKAAIQLVLFHTLPTVIADHAAFAPTAADMQKILQVVKIAATDYVDYGALSVANVGNLRIPFSAVVGANLIGKIWASLVATATPDYVATTDLQLTLLITA